MKLASELKILKEKFTLLNKENNLLNNVNNSLVEENTLLNARCNEYEQAYEYLKEQLLNLKRQIFGKRSERFIDLEAQPSLFDKEALWNTAIIPDMELEKSL